MTQYFIMINRIDGLDRVEVVGHKVTIPGFAKFEFFIHRPYDPNHNIPENMTGWAVSEASTGWMVASGFYQRDARIEATKRLNRDGVEKFRKRLDKAKAFMVDNQRCEVVS